MKGRISIWFFDIIHYHAVRLNTFKHLAEEHGYKVFIYSLREGAPDRPTAGYHNLLGENVKVFMKPEDRINSMETVKALLESLWRDGADVVVIPGYNSWPALVALAWCKLKSRAAVLMSDSQRQDYPRSGWRERLKRHLVKRFDAALVAGAPQVEYARELGLAPEVIFQGYDVVDNLFWQEGADKARNNGETLRRQMGLPLKYFVAAKRFIPKKNIEGLLESYALYRSWAGHQAWHLVLCGSGPLEGAIRGKIDQLGLKDWVLLPGYQDADNMVVFYGLASAFVHASSYAEQWGLVVNEAMASGLPVLVSEICGCAQDLVRDGANGFKFDPHDVEGLARLLLKIASGEVDLKAMGQASREIIAAWSPETFAGNLLKAIEAAQSARRRRGRPG